MIEMCASLKFVHSSEMLTGQSVKPPNIFISNWAACACTRACVCLSDDAAHLIGTKYVDLCVGLIVAD